MKIFYSRNIRTKLTIWYVAVLAGILTIYIAMVFSFQYLLLQRQIFHDEVQDVETVEGLLFFDLQGDLHLQQNYYSHPRSHLLIDRLMEVRDVSGIVLYRSETLHGLSLGGPTIADEGGSSFNERVVKLSDGTHVLLISHLHPVDGRQLLIRLGYSLAPLSQRMFDFLLLLLMALPLALIVAGFAGYSIAKKALNPLDQMAARAQQITAGNLHDRINIVNPHDELGHMARVLNLLLERLEKAFSQMQRFTANAAHELQTPLAALRCSGEVALQENRTEYLYRETISSMLEETARLSQTIEGLLLLARTEASPAQIARSCFTFQDVVNELLSLLEILIEEHHISVQQAYSQDAPGLLFADRSLIRVALLNVLHNAIKFSPDGSVLRITYSQQDASARVCIHDAGPGIAAEEHQRVFERFFKGSWQPITPIPGTGLGLSIAEQAIRRDGGRIYFDETVSSGACCYIELPISTAGECPDPIPEINDPSLPHQGSGA